MMVIVQSQCSYHNHVIDKYLLLLIIVHITYMLIFNSGKSVNLEHRKKINKISLPELHDHDLKPSFLSKPPKLQGKWLWP